MFQLEIEGGWNSIKIEFPRMIMRKMTSDEIRDTWLKFFEKHGHYIEPSASLVPNNDPTLLWINAGVAALKKYFDGSMTPKHRRITNAQKCIRTNDIDNVGHTARHHTFFEMMGNFSIGDYFRDEVIPWAYELLTSEEYFGLDPKKLFVTYYPDDQATHDLWVKCGIPEENMVPSESNFWEIGEGPCGPDTEINYDRGEKYDPQGLGLELLKKDLDNDRYIELWNIVFSQFNSMPGVARKDYKQLPQKNIDTGAGLERLACIMQETETNFETDLFYPYIEALMAKSKFPYEGKYKLAYRVIADHIRSITFALADGAVFSNDGRGYVLKRLLRRASRYAQTLGLPAGTLASLVPLVTEHMSHFYPYLKDHQERTMKMIQSEENKFANTLKTGEKILSSLLAQEGDTLSGEDCFKLADTYGFPFELTKEIAHDSGKNVDENRYLELLKESKELARKSRGDKQSFGSQSKDLIAFTTPSEFTYEEGVDITSKVTGIFVDGVKVSSLTEEGDIALEKTNFYALSGGQVSDTGFLKNDSCEAQVFDVTSANHGQHLLHVKVLYGEIKEGDELLEKVDWERRNLIRKNHSATHLLQKALQEVLSPDIHQEGAYYDENLLRFDINYDGKIKEESLNAVERRVNEMIYQGFPVKTEILTKEEALQKNAMHLFSEKYGDFVRVVSMGSSLEFCGGTHVDNTAEINLFVIVSEESVAAGIRRITALTGMKAFEYLKEKQTLINEAASLLKVNTDREVRGRILANNKETAQLKDQIKALREANTNALFAELESKMEKREKGSLLVCKLKGLTHEQEDSLAHKLIDKHKDLLLFLVVDNGPKADLVSARGEALSSLRAGQIMKEVSSLLSGRGGGRNDVAFGGTDNLSGFDQIKGHLEGLLK